MKVDPMTTKFASEYPLPGGVDQYFNSLISLLKRVSEAPPEQHELVDFVFQQYPRTRGSTAVGQYLAHITRSGLRAVKDGKYRLTPNGNSLADNVESDCDAARRMLFLFLGFDAEVIGGPGNPDVVIDFEFDGPGGTATGRSAWIVRIGDEVPRLVTCYIL